MADFVFERHGNNHDVYVRGTEGEEVPRHKEINGKLAKAIGEDTLNGCFYYAYN